MRRQYEGANGAKYWGRPGRRNGTRQNALALAKVIEGASAAGERVELADLHINLRTQCLTKRLLPKGLRRTV